MFCALTHLGVFCFGMCQDHGSASCLVVKHSQLEALDCQMADGWLLNDLIPVKNRLGVAEFLLALALSCFLFLSFLASLPE